MLCEEFFLDPPFALAPFRFFYILCRLAILTFRVIFVGGRVWYFFFRLQMFQFVLLILEVRILCVFLCLGNVFFYTPYKIFIFLIPFIKLFKKDRLINVCIQRSDWTSDRQKGTDILYIIRVLFRHSIETSVGADFDRPLQFWPSPVYSDHASWHLVWSEGTNMSKGWMPFTAYPFHF